MKADADCRLALLVSCVILVLSAPARAREQPGTQSSLETRDEREAFLSNASFVTNAPTDGTPSWRAGLDDGTRRHDASVVTEDGSSPTRRNYRFNVPRTSWISCSALIWSRHRSSDPSTAGRPPSFGGLTTSR